MIFKILIYFRVRVNQDEIDKENSSDSNSLTLNNLRKIHSEADFDQDRNCRSSRLPLVSSKSDKSNSIFVTNIALLGMQVKN